MSVNALLSQGLVLARGDGASPEAFTAIPEASNIQGPGGNTNIIDVSDLASTSREKLPGLPDEGQVTFQIFYIPGNAVHAGLRADRAGSVLRNFRITFTDSPATVWTFAAYVVGFSHSANVDAAVTVQVTLEVTGAIVES